MLAQLAGLAALWFIMWQVSALSELSDTVDIFDDGKSDKEILDDLLKNSRYDKRLLPPVSGTLTVNMSVLLLSLASPDESSLKYEVEFLLQQQWVDPRLQYSNHSRYDFLNAIHHHSDIWLPDTYFIMHGDFKDPLIPVHFALRIFRNGTVNYLMRFLRAEPNPIRVEERRGHAPDVAVPYLAQRIPHQELHHPLPHKGQLERELQLPQGGPHLYQRPRLLLHDGLHPGHHPGHQLLHHLLARVERGARARHDWRDDNAQLFHHFQRFPVDAARRVQPHGHERVGRRVHVLHLRVASRVCGRQLRGQEEAPAQRGVPPGGEPRHPGRSCLQGENKKEGSTGPSEIVSCTNCGPNPCTHPANNGCVTEVRKREPPHPIRVAKTIDVIARITFPAAYAVFLVFFFYYYPDPGSGVP
nr:glutamate-gated chloride channel B [Thrips tabaci]